MTDTRSIPTDVRERVDSNHIEHAEQIKQQQLDTAFTKLDTNGTLSAEERIIIETMADRIVVQLFGFLLLAPTERTANRDRVQADK